MRQDEVITPLTQNEVDAFTPYSYFAAAAYCNAEQIMDWNCGTNCDANPAFTPLAQGGDPPGGIPAWYVGYHGAQQTVVVAHQGTNTEYMCVSWLLPLQRPLVHIHCSLEILTDENSALSPLDPELFPGAPSSLLVHTGFRNAQADQANEIRTAVLAAMTTYGAQSVTIVGHSLGAAVALLDVLYLSLNIPSGIELRAITYGMPRVGNPNFASFVDEQVTSLHHINNKKDPVPTVPLLDFLGLVYASPNGEVHIVENGTWENCPGHDNPSPYCIVGAVPNIFTGDETDHDGPYNGVEMGSKGCSTAAPIPKPTRH